MFIVINACEHSNCKFIWKQVFIRIIFEITRSSKFLLDLANFETQHFLFEIKKDGNLTRKIQELHLAPWHQDSLNRSICGIKTAKKVPNVKSDVSRIFKV